MAKMRMGRRTGQALFGTKENTYANKFCRMLLNAGDMGLSMAEAKRAPWNPKNHSFVDTGQRLIIEGLAKYDEDDDRYYVTKKGLAEARTLPKDQVSIEDLGEATSNGQEKSKKSNIRLIGKKWHMHLQNPGSKPFGPVKGNQSVRTVCGVMRMVRNTTTIKKQVTCPWCIDGRTFNS